MNQPVYIHFTDLPGAKAIRDSGKLLQSSYVEAIFAIAVGGTYSPGVQRGSLGRAKNRNVAVYFTTDIIPDYCYPEECVWHGDAIPVKVLKVGSAQHAIPLLNNKFETDEETGQIIGIETRDSKKMPNRFSLMEAYLSEKPEGLPSDIFGVSFDDMSKRKPETKPPEPNTRIEDEILNLLSTHIDENDPTPKLGKLFLTYIEPAIKQGKYPQFKAPPGLVYRGIRLTGKTFQKITKLSSKEVTEQPGSGWYVGSPGILTPEKSSKFDISSWSLDPKVAINFATEEENEILVVFVADTRNPKNRFFINPDMMNQLYSARRNNLNIVSGRSVGRNPYGQQMTKEEREIIGVGPIEFKEFIFYRTPNFNNHDYENSDTFWPVPSQSPDWKELERLFGDTLQQELPDRLFADSFKLRDGIFARRAFRKVLPIITKNWKENKKPDFSEFEDAIDDYAENFGGSGKYWTKGPYSFSGGKAKIDVSKIKKIFITGLLKYLSSTKGIFPRDIAFYNPEQSFLYSLGLRKELPKVDHNLDY